jgi:hypothetical protein
VTFAIAWVAACVHPSAPDAPRPQPPSTVQVGACGDPTHDGVFTSSASGTLEHADRDLDGDGVPEVIVTDRSQCTSEGNCYWNVFAARANDCTRYLGTFVAAALEPLTARGDDNMVDVRGYYNLHGGRILLQGYHFVRGGYEQTEALVCRRSTDDKLACAEDTDSHGP